MQRMVGPENLMLWVGALPGADGRVYRTHGPVCLESAKAQIKARPTAVLDGIVIWGDMAYRKDLFFSPDYWRKWYKPGLKALVDESPRARPARDLSWLWQRQARL